MTARVNGTIKPLVWREGFGTIQTADIMGYRYVIGRRDDCGSWVWWREDFAHVKSNAANEEAAKAAAQADYEARILAQIEPDPEAQPVTDLVNVLEEARSGLVAYGLGDGSR